MVFDIRTEKVEDKSLTTKKLWDFFGFFLFL